MSVRDDIAALLADASLTPDQRQKAVRRLKAEQMRIAAHANRLPLSFNAGSGVRVTVNSAELSWDDIALTIEITHNGAPVPFDNPLIIVNPPLMVPDPQGEVELPGATGEYGTTAPQRFRLAPIAALRELISDLAIKAAGV